jgi:WD40 repeat protein
MESKPESSSDELKQPATNATPGRAEVFDSVIIPDHQLLRCIGRGSYGTVLLARNSLGAYRAVKIVYRKSFSDQRPFERELSGIRKFEPVSRSHEGFIDVLHVGINEAEGYFYYVMELGDDCISGQNFDSDQYIPKTLAKEISRRGALGVKDCLQLGLALSDALSELHRCGLVHRDIKPSNIIFVNGAPKLADIGLVAGLDDTRSYVGTEGFIPPEGPGSPQADVYSLGKVLYEACTGRDRQDFPELPTRVEELGDREQFLELNEVILHACKNESAKRYESASNMHADLVLVSNGKSVKRLKLLEQRLARLKHASGIAALVLAVGLIFSYPTYQEWRLRLENRQRQVGEKVAYGLRAVEGGDLLTALPQFAEALRLDQSSKERALTHRLRFGAALAQTPKLTRVWSTANEVESGQFSPDGNKVLVAQVYGPPLLYEISTGRRLTLPVKVSHSVSAAFSTNGHSIVISGHETNVSVWDIITGQLLLSLPHPSLVSQATFSPNGQFILTSCDDGLARLWSVRSGQIERWFTHSTNVTFATFSHNGKFVATTSYDGTCRIWNVADGSPAGGPLRHGSWVNYAAFSPDERLLVTASWDHTARVWEWAENRQIPPDMPHADGVTSAEFSPDGQFIVTACADGTVRLWNAHTFLPCEGNSFLQHGVRATGAHIAPDGHRILTTCVDGSVRVWDLAGASLPPRPAPVSFSADASSYLENSNGIFTVRDSLSDARISQFTGPASLSNPVQLNGNGQFAWGIAAAEGAPAGSLNRIFVWNANTGQTLSSNILFSNLVSGASLSDNGGQIVIFGDRMAQIWDLSLNKPLSPLLIHPQAVSRALFNHNGTQAAIGSAGRVRVWDCSNDKDCFPPLPHPVDVSDFAFSPNGSLLATCCADQSLDKYFAQIWDSGTGHPAGPRLMHGDGVLCLAFSPDGKRLVTGGEDFVAKLWDVQTGKPLPQALRHANQVKSVAFSPNGRWIVTVSLNIVQIWDSDSGDPITPRLRNLVSVSRANFLPDGATVVVCNANNTAWRWRLPADPKPTADLSAIASLLSGGPDENQGAGPVLKPGHLEVTWQGLATNYTSDFTVSSDQVAAWHEFQAAEYEQNNKWFAAVFHLKQLLLLRPSDQTLRQRLARAQEHLKGAD